MKKINVITMFSGYDSQCLALNRLGIPYELVGWCEVDRYAIRAHNALFPQWKDRNFGDVRSVLWSEVREKIDLLTYSSPCQDFSNAGKQAGGARGSGTRSGLLWECERAIGVLKPRYLVFENVPALASGKFIGTFLAWAKTLELFGYRSYWRCLNAKHFGVPQNRNRVFLVSILGDGQPYYFPKKFKLERRLKDLLEKDVDERYYLSEGRVRDMMENFGIEQADGNGYDIMPHTPGEIQVYVEQYLLNGDKEGNASTLTTGHDCASHITDPQGGHKQMGVMEIHSEVLGWTRDGKGAVVDRHPVDVANCVTAEKASNTQNYVRETTFCRDGVLYIPQGTKQGYAAVSDGGVFDMAFPTSKTRRGRVQEGGSVSPTVMSESNCLMLYQKMRIRRLTERELFRLMDVDDKDIDILLAAGIPKTQLAKMAGNSIVVNVLYHIFKRLFVDTEPTVNEQLKLF